MTKLRFTKTALQALPIPEQGQRQTIYDTEVPKLALRLTHAGARTFYVVRRVGAAMAWMKLGAFPEMTVEQARAEAQKLLAEFAKGANPAEAKRAYRGEATFQEVFDDYLAHKRKRNGEPLAERTKTEYQNHARLYLPEIMPLKLSAVGHERVAKLHRKIGKTTPFAANRAKALVSSVFNYARDRRMYSGENPAAGIQGFAEESRDRFAGADELPRLYEAIAQSPQRDYFLLSLLTGARRANVQAMAWRDVDLTAGVWRIGKTKNGTPQNVTLSPEASAVLKSRKEGANGSPFVFPGSGKTGHLVEPKNSWDTIKRTASLARLLDAMGVAGVLDADAREEADALALTRLSRAEKRYRAEAESAKIDPADFSLSDLRIHDLRRTLGSWQAMTGASLAIIGKSLNHKTHQATAIYARLDLDPVRQSVNTATSAMMEAAGLKDRADVVKLNGKRSKA
ncbi:tyrosine-type recombinase/integrase [Aromatoleum anaerobium]|nr:site-specific integrase [Aromatoleum anaerobium]MCK0506326.1 tyrosine-type recombinase/integrase [Aromatoleum anaerobium]